MKNRTKAMLGGVAILMAVLIFTPQKVKAFVMGSPVQVVNLLAQWIPTGSIDEPGRSPVEFAVSMTGNGQIVGNPYVVPANRRMVMKHVSANCVSAGGVPRGQINATTNNQFMGTHIGPVTAFANGSLYQNTFSSDVLAYADPGQVVQLLFVGQTTGYLSCDTTVAGYLVDVTAPGQ